MNLAYILSAAFILLEIGFLVYIISDGYISSKKFEKKQLAVLYDKWKMEKFDNLEN